MGFQMLYTPIQPTGGLHHRVFQLYKEVFESIDYNSGDAFISFNFNMILRNQQ